MDFLTSQIEMIIQNRYSARFFILYSVRHACVSKSKRALIANYARSSEIYTVILNEAKVDAGGKYS